MVACVCVCVSVCAGFVGEVSIVTLFVGGKRLYYFEEPFPAPLSLASVWNSAKEAQRSDGREVGGGDGRDEQEQGEWTDQGGAEQDAVDSQGLSKSFSAAWLLSGTRA